MSPSTIRMIVHGSARPRMPFGGVGSAAGKGLTGFDAGGFAAGAAPIKRSAEAEAASRRRRSGRTIPTSYLELRNRELRVRPFGERISANGTKERSRSKGLAQERERVHGLRHW